MKITFCCLCRHAGQSSFTCSVVLGFHTITTYSTSILNTVLAEKTQAWVSPVPQHPLEYNMVTFEFGIQVEFSCPIKVGNEWLRETAAWLWHGNLHTDPWCVTSVLQKLESISGGGHLFTREKCELLNYSKCINRVRESAACLTPVQT